MLYPSFTFWLRTFCLITFISYVCLLSYSLNFVHFCLWRIGIITTIFAVFFFCMAKIKSDGLRSKLVALAKNTVSPFRECKDTTSYNKTIKTNTDKQLAKLLQNPQYQRYKALRMKAKDPNDVYLVENKNQKDVEETIKILETMEDVIYGKPNVKN